MLFECEAPVCLQDQLDRLTKILSRLVERFALCRCARNLSDVGDVPALFSFFEDGRERVDQLGCCHGVRCHSSYSVLPVEVLPYDTVFLKALALTPINTIDMNTSAATDSHKSQNVAPRITIPRAMRM